MYQKFKNSNFYLLFGADPILFTLAHLLAYSIRFEFSFSDSSIHQMILALPFIIPFKSFVFWRLGIYRGIWQYNGINDLLRLFKATVFSSLVIVVTVLFIYRFMGFSRAVFILDGTLTFLLTGGLRFCIRMFYQKKSSDQGFFGIKRNRNKTPVFIIGAGDTGEKTLREIIENPNLPYQVRGFIDDDPGKWGKTIHEVPVLGGIESLGQHVEMYGVKELFIAAPSASGDQMRKIVEACEISGLKFKTLPGWNELIDGKVSIKAIRNVDYNDLLRRPPVVLNAGQIEDYLKGRIILVTGAGGSIGSELCRQIARFKPDTLIFFDASEGNLYNIQMEFRHRAGYLNCVTILGDVQNRAILDRIFSRYKPHVVFHAAAYKHVPMMEQNPWQAVHNNIRGTRVLMDATVRHKTEYFVLVSTDKAVRPVNVMGASKRVCELLLQAFQGNGTRMIAVRFGNVLASSGSVIPLFRSQIARGGPVTVTHPEVTRYFMTIPEAVQLIIQAGALGKGGEIFILKMGTAIKIADMARDLIRFSGKRPDIDIQIVFTGLRPGEKLYEELIAEGEHIASTDYKNIMILESDLSRNGLNSRDIFRQWLIKRLDELDHLAEKQDSCGIKEKLAEVVPEYKAQNTECVL